MSLLGQHIPSGVLSFLPEYDISMVFQPSEKEPQEQKPIHQNNNRSLPLQRSPENSHYAVDAFAPMSEVEVQETTTTTLLSSITVSEETVKLTRSTQTLKELDLGLSGSDSEVDVVVAPIGNTSNTKRSICMYANSRENGSQGSVSFCLDYLTSLGNQKDRHPISNYSD